MGEIKIDTQKRKEQKKRWRMGNPEKIKRTLKKWREKNPERVKEYAKRRWVNNREKLTRANADYHFKRQGISKEKFGVLLERQGGCCAICHKIPDVGKRLHVDHDHKTKKIRGLLCFRCNMGIGIFDDDINRIMVAANYLLTKTKNDTILKEVENDS